MLNRPCIFGKNILCSQYTIELVSWSFTWDWGNRGTRELLHLWPNGSIYISFLVVVQVLWRKILQAHVPTPGIERIELKSKFGALRYSLDPRLIILPLVGTSLLPSLTGCLAKSKNSCSVSPETIPPNCYRAGKGESPDGEDANGSLFKLSNYLLIFSVNRGLANILCVIHMIVY